MLKNEKDEQNDLKFTKYKETFLIYYLDGESLNNQT